MCELLVTFVIFCFVDIVIARIVLYDGVVFYLFPLNPIVNNFVTTYFFIFR